YDKITNDRTLNINGAGPANATIVLYMNGNKIGSTTANASGTFTFDYTGTTLAEGNYAFQAAVVFGSAIGPLSNPLNATVDLTAPTVTVRGPDSTTSVTPTVSVATSDAVGFSATATVHFDVDTDNDNDFADSGEMDFTTAVITDAQAGVGLNLG